VIKETVQLRRLPVVRYSAFTLCCGLLDPLSFVVTENKTEKPKKKIYFKFCSVL